MDTKKSTTPQITAMPSTDLSHKKEESISDSSSDTGYSTDSESDTEGKQMLKNSARKSIGLPPLNSTPRTALPASPQLASPSVGGKRKSSSLISPDKKKKRASKHDLTMLKNKTSDVLKGKKIAVQGTF
jgi:hypothetical protein